MAKITLSHTSEPKEIEVEIGVVGFDLSEREAIVRLRVDGYPKIDERVDMMPTYQGMTATQQNTVKAWYRQQIALGQNQKFGTDLDYTDIPNTIFDDEPEIID